MPFDIKSLQKICDVVYLWLKPKSVTFADKFVPQDFNIKTAPGFKGPACYIIYSFDTFISSHPEATPLQ